MPEQPIDAATLDEAAQVLGSHMSSARRLLDGAGLLERDDDDFESLVLTPSRPR